MFVECKRFSGQRPSIYQGNDISDDMPLKNTAFSEHSMDTFGLKPWENRKVPLSTRIINLFWLGDLRKPSFRTVTFITFHWVSSQQLELQQVGKRKSHCYWEGATPNKTALVPVCFFWVARTPRNCGFRPPPRCRNRPRPQRRPWRNDGDHRAWRTSWVAWQMWRERFHNKSI